MITVWILAIITFLLIGLSIINLVLTIILSLLFALFFYFKTIGQLKALEYLPSNKMFPITTGSVILVIIFSVLYFQDTLSATQIMGILLILASVFLIHYFSKKSKDYKISSKGFIFAFLAILPSAIAEIINKFASLNAEISSFIIITYTFLILVSFSYYSFSKDKPSDKLSKTKSIKIGVLVGLFNFLGYFSLLTAMKTGPLSLIVSIHAGFVIVAAILSSAFKLEKLTLLRLSLAVLTVIGVILIRI